MGSPLPPLLLLHMPPTMAHKDHHHPIGRFLTDMDHGRGGGGRGRGGGGGGKRGGKGGGGGAGGLHYQPYVPKFLRELGGGGGAPDGSIAGRKRALDAKFPSGEGEQDDESEEEVDFEKLQVAIPPPALAWTT